MFVFQGEVKANNVFFCGQKDPKIVFTIKE